MAYNLISVIYSKCILVHVSCHFALQTVRVFIKPPFIMYHCVISQYTIFLLYATIICLFIF